MPFYGFYQTTSFAFLLEAYIDGPSLKDNIRRNRNKPYSVKDALVYMKALCAALGYAHSYGVIHCDVKPGNVMLDNGGNIYLADFGIARHAESTTTTFATVGTAAYMAPEQIRGEPVSAATDVYALGIVFFELLTGRRPFQGDEKTLQSSGTTAGERLRAAHLTLPAPDPRIFNSQIPETLAKLIQQSMSKEQKDRPDGAMDLYSKALQAASLVPDGIPDRASLELIFASSSFQTLPEHPIPGGENFLPSSPDIPLKSSIDQRKLGISIVAIVTILVIGSLFLIGSKLIGQGVTSNKNSQLTLAALSTQIAESAPISMTVTETLEERIPTKIGPVPTSTFASVELPTATLAPSLPPSQTPLPSGLWGQIAFTCQIYKNHLKNQICLMNANGSSQIRLTSDDNADHAWPSISPDGRSVIYAANNTGEYEIYEMDLSSRRFTQLTSSRRNSAPAISPDGKYIVYIHKVGDFRQLWVMDRSGNNQHPLIGSDQWGAWDGTWSSDSSQVLFASDMDGEIELYTVDLNGLNLKKITNIAQDYSSNQRLRGRNDWSPDGKWIATYLGKSWNWEILLTNTDGTQTHTITDGGNNLAPSFSPNGEWITFTSYRDRYSDEHGCEIYIMRTDGSDVQRLTNNGYCDWQPRWGP